MNNGSIESSPNRGGGLFFDSSLKISDIKAFLFDMDGVLFDSMKNHAVAWTRAMDQCGLHMEPEEVYMNEGRTGEGTIDMFTMVQWGRKATPAEIENIYHVKSEIFNSLPKAEQMDGAMEVLEAVRAMGLLRVIVTGSGQKSLLERLDRNFPGMFCQEQMVTAFDVRFGKPNPEPYQKGLLKAGIALGLEGPLPAEQAVVVENAPLGIQAAKAAGIYTIAVNTGPLDDSILLDAGADVVLSGMRELSERLQSFL